MQKYELAIKKTYKEKDYYSKRVASKFEVADWELKVVIPGTAHMDCF